MQQVAWLMAGSSPTTTIAQSRNKYGSAPPSTLTSGRFRGTSCGISRGWRREWRFTPLERKAWNTSLRLGIRTYAPGGLANTENRQSLQGSVRCGRDVFEGPLHRQIGRVGVELSLQLMAPRPAMASSALQTQKAACAGAFCLGRLEFDSPGQRTRVLPAASQYPEGAALASTDCRRRRGGCSRSVSVLQRSPE